MMHQTRCNGFWKTFDALLRLRRTKDVKVLEYDTSHIARAIFNH